MNCGRGGLERKVSGGEWAQPLTHKKTGAAPITPLQSRRQCPAHASQRWQALSMEYSQVHPKCQPPSHPLVNCLQYLA